MRSVLLVIGVFCLLSIPSTVVACSCATGDPAFEFNRAKAIFTGRMLRGTERLSVKDEGGLPRALEAGKVRFTVEEVFKGGVVGEVTIEIDSMDGTSCGPYGLKRGERYLVYAYAGEKDEKILYSGVCTRTVDIRSKYAKDDLNFLRNLPPANTGGNLRGRVWADLGKRPTPLPDVMVKIRSADEQLIRVFTDKDGRFEVKQLKPGKYTVEPEFPPNYVSDQKSSEVQVDDRGTAAVGFEAYIDGRVSGRVLDKQGNGFNSIFLNLDSGANTVFGHAKGEDGRFEVKGAPPGEYVLYLEMRHADYNKNKKYYFPGTFEREKATVIRVGVGEKIEGLEFLLPEGFSVRTIEGEVLWKDGKPGAAVEVMLLCPQSSVPEGFVVEFGPPSTRTDEQGRFRLEGITGETYWIEARGNRASDKKDEIFPMHSPSRKLTLSESVKNVKLVLSEYGMFGDSCPE